MIFEKEIPPLPHAEPMHRWRMAIFRDGDRIDVFAAHPNHPALMLWAYHWIEVDMSPMLPSAPDDEHDDSLGRELRAMHAEDE